MIYQKLLESKHTIRLKSYLWDCGPQETRTVAGTIPRECSQQTTHAGTEPVGKHGEEIWEKAPKSFRQTITHTVPTSYTTHRLTEGIETC